VDPHSSSRAERLNGPMGRITMRQKNDLGERISRRCTGQPGQLHASSQGSLLFGVLRSYHSRPQEPLPCPLTRSWRRPASGCTRGAPSEGPAPTSPPPCPSCTWCPENHSVEDQCSSPRRHCQHHHRSWPIHRPTDPSPRWMHDLCMMHQPLECASSAATDPTCTCW
jgi:hypothetical protein